VHFDGVALSTQLLQVASKHLRWLGLDKVTTPSALQLQLSSSLLPVMPDPYQYDCAVLLLEGIQGIARQTLLSGTCRSHWTFDLPVGVLALEKGRVSMQ
jgi:hypothetical protein